MFEALMETVRHQVDRHRNRPFMEAAMACAAMVAMADGKVSFSERAKLDQIVETLTELRVFDVHEEIDRFNDYVDAIADGDEAAWEDALDAIRRCAPDREAAKLIAKIGLAVAHADGTFSLEERALIKQICTILGLKTNKLDLT